MSNNQELTQKVDIKEFKKQFYHKYGVELYIYSAGEPNYKIGLDIFEECALIALKKNNPRYNYMDNMQSKLRSRPYLVYTQAMSYLAYVGGHTKSSIGQYINKNHATIINSIKQVENALFTKEPMLNDALNNTLKEIENYVGIIPEDITSKLNSQSNSDPIWDKARRFIAKHN
jgi:hypothetical protein|tara:strand:- start:2004 stop:2522 length:519 start_codon:yes stop_codon:yes gene_type:complete